MSEGQAISFVPVGGGTYGWSPRESGYGPQVLLVRSKEEWGKLADSFSMDPSQTPPESDARIRAVDFARQSILVVTLGETGSTGYSISLERIESGPPVKLVMKSKFPAPGEMTGAAMTHPFYIVVLDATELPADAVFERDGKRVEVERVVRGE